jgi:ABC-2 type transport system permease protein
MNAVAAIVHQLRYDLLRLVRNRQSLVLTLLVPIVFLVVLAAVFGSNRVGVNGTLIPTSVYYVPAIIVFAVVNASFGNLTVSVTRDRDSGIYKRRRATPARGVALIGGRALVSVVVGLAMTALLAVIGRVAYHASPGGTGPGGAGLTVGVAALALTVIIGAFSFACLAYAAVSLVREPDSAQLVATLGTLPLFFISGVFIPGPRLPHGLSLVAQAFPVQHLAHALLVAYTAPVPLPLGDLGVIAGWGALGLVVAARRFTWSPRV